jgi:hypothetical protein
VATDLPEVERRGTLELIEAAVGCLCMLAGMEAAEDWREWAEGE